MNDVDIFVGARIRAQRAALGMSQTELGNMIGVRFQQVQKYEAGINRVSASRLWTIADALGVDISYFFEGIDNARTERRAGKNSCDFLADPRSVEIARLFHALPENQKDAVLAFLRSLTPDHKDENLSGEGGTD